MWLSSVAQTNLVIIILMVLMAYGSLIYFLSIVSPPINGVVFKVQYRPESSSLNFSYNGSEEETERRPIIKHSTGLDKGNGTSVIAPITSLENFRDSNQISDNENAQVNASQVVVVDQFPGAFANNMLFLQGARLTTSYEETVNDVHVDLFGFQGDAARSKDRNHKCHAVPPELKDTLLDNAQIGEKLLLFCQLDKVKDHRKMDKGNDLIPALFVPVKSIDFTQNQATTIWRCNVTDQLNRRQLRDKAEHIAPLSPSFETVHFWMKYTNDTTAPVTRIATFRIPLDTGVAGMGGPHIRGGRFKSYFHQPPVSAGLCVAVYGRGSLHYLPEFIQHHLNVGFESIVIGVRGSDDNAELKEAQQLVQRYIDQGLVSLAYYGSPFQCSDDLSKIPFYRTCLYHHKGLTPFSATWDVDEFWLPPKVLQVDGNHDYRHYQLLENWKEKVIANDTSIATSDARITTSSWSTFPPVVRNDPLWQSSPYARSVSIVDTIQAIERYYVKHKCADAWCYHVFPSQRVNLRGGDNGGNRTGFIGDDFEMRDFIYDNGRQKSFAITKYAHLAGFHSAGSCYFEGNGVNASLPYKDQFELFHGFARTSNCGPFRFDSEIYGSMHHFWELLATRANKQKGDTRTTVDEYVSLLAPTVKRQLERNTIASTKV